MRSLSTLISCAVVALLGSAGADPSAAAELKVSGAATVANTIVIPNKAALERDTGLTLAITVNGDGNGLKDLTAGRSDVMMVAAPLKVTEEAVNKVAPGSASVAGVELSPIGTVPIRFIVNPANPVRSLTQQQLTDILIGRITSWKEVGGQDQPIMVIAEVPGFGTRANIVTTLLGGTEITDKARIVQALVQVAQVVGQAPNALGYGNHASITGAVAVLPGIEVKQPIGFATRGQPSAEAKRLIEAAARFASADH
jgi:phosphate transport system substrate-binding protein